MQCSAILRSGRPCSREARADAQLCAFHQTVELRREVRAFHHERVALIDGAALAAATQVKGVEDEIGMLRVLIRRAANTGDLEAVRRGTDSLARLLQTAQRLGGQTSDLERWLDRVIPDLGMEPPEDSVIPDPGMERTDLPASRS